MKKTGLLVTTAQYSWPVIYQALSARVERCSVDTTVPFPLLKQEKSGIAIMVRTFCCFTTTVVNFLTRDSFTQSLDLKQIG